jgi:hypothetical protein
MTRWSEQDLQVMINRGKHPLKAIDKLLKQRGPVYKNKWELNYSKVLDLEQKAGVIRSWRYEGLTFTLAKRQYHRIDFIIGHNDRSIELAQVKGKWHPNIRAGMKCLKWAAQLYPMFTWTLKNWTGTGWDSRYVEV